MTEANYQMVEALWCKLYFYLLRTNRRDNFSLKCSLVFHDLFLFLVRYFLNWPLSFASLGCFLSLGYTECKFHMQKKCAHKLPRNKRSISDMQSAYVSKSHRSKTVKTHRYNFCIGCATRLLGNKKKLYEIRHLTYR